MVLVKLVCPARLENGAVHRFLIVYEPVFLVLRCHVFYDKKPLCYSYDRVTSLISNFLEPVKEKIKLDQKLEKLLKKLNVI